MALSRWASPLPTGPKVSIMESPTSETVIERFLAVRVSTGVGVGDGVGVTRVIGVGMGVGVMSGIGDTIDVSGTTPNRSPKLTDGFVIKFGIISIGVGSGNGEMIVSAAYTVAVKRNEQAIIIAIQRMSLS